MFFENAKKLSKEKTIKHRNAGFFSIENLFGIIIGLVMFVSLYEYLDGIITAVIPTVDAMTAGILKLFCVGIVVMLLLGTLSFLPSTRSRNY